MIRLVKKIDEEAKLWEKTKDEKHKENWYKLLKQFSTYLNNPYEQE